LRPEGVAVEVDGGGHNGDVFAEFIEVICQVGVAHDHGVHGFSDVFSGPTTERPIVPDGVINVQQSGAGEQAFEGLVALHQFFAEPNQIGVAAGENGRDASGHFEGAGQAATFFEKGNVFPHGYSLLSQSI